MDATQQCVTADNYHRMTSDILLPKSRLQSLYRDFRDLKELNKDGYEANINTWKDFLLKTMLNDKGKLTLHCGADILNDLRTDVYGEPKSIDVVLDAWIKDNTLLTSEFFYDPQQTDIDQSPKNSNLLTRLFGYLSIGGTEFTTRKVTSESSYLKDIKLFIKDNIKETAGEVITSIKEEIIANSSSSIDLIMDTDSFKNRCGISKLVKNESDQDVLLYYLEQYAHVILRNHNVIKVINKRESSADENIPDNTITESDLNIVLVKSTISKLDREISKLEKDINTIIAKQHSKNYHELSRDSQKAILKSRIITKRYRDRLTANRENLKAILQELRTSTTNKMIVDTLQKSHNTIKMINESIGPVEKIDELMENIAEQRDITQNVTEALSKPSEIMDTIPDSEIEEELAELEQQMKTGKQEAPNNDEEVLKKLENLNIKENVTEGSNVSIESSHEVERNLIPEA